MKTIKTSIAKTYVSNWGINEGIREILQNAIDANVRGSEMIMNYDSDHQALEITSVGSYLDMSDFLLGTTTKKDSENQIGEHGEGYKLACLALLREGKEISIYNGPKANTYEPKLVYDESYNATLLAFDVDEFYAPTDKLIFTIGNIDLEEWQDIQMRFPCITNWHKEDSIETNKGLILTNEDCKGNVYVSGLFIANYKELAYGYDFNVDSIELDRDRGVCNWFDLRWATSNMWSQCGDDAVIYEMMKDDCPDIEFIKNFTDKDLSKNLTDQFIAENEKEGEVGGKTSYPVTSNYEAEEVKALGLTPIFSDQVLADTVRETLGEIGDIRRSLANELEELDMTNLAQSNVYWALGMVQNINPEFTINIQSAEFKIASISSLHKGNVLYMNEATVENKYDVLHELIKHFSLIFDLKETQVWKRLVEHMGM